MTPPDPATRNRIAVIVAAAGLLLTGCGPTTAAPSSGARPATAAGTAASTAAATTGAGLTACELVTTQDASTALGTDAGPGTAGGSAALSECIYDEGTLIVSMKTDAKALYDKSYNDATAKGATDVPGIGDGAFLTGSAADDHCDIEFLKGTTLVSILLNNTGAHAAAVALATSAASKL